MNPLRVTGCGMPPNLLLMVKILALAMLVKGTGQALPEPFLPFLPGLDRLVDPAAFRLILMAIFFLAALGVLFNRWLRTSCLLLGGSLLVAVLSCHAYYMNNKVFTGLLLILAGLSDFDRPDRLFRWQLALVYLGAGLNKLLEPDWQSGQFFDHWAGATLANPVYLALASWMAPLVLGKLLCWGTILGELACVPGFLVPRWTRYALGFSAGLQFSILWLTGTTFGEFFYAMLAVTLAFVVWPPALEAQHPPGSPWPRRLRPLDPDGLLRWRPGPQLQVPRSLLLFSPVFWLAATGLVGGLAGRGGWPLRLSVLALAALFLRSQFPILQTEE